MAGGRVRRLRKKDEGAERGEKGKGRKGERPGREQQGAIGRNYETTCWRHEMHEGEEENGKRRWAGGWGRGGGEESQMAARTLLSDKEE